MPGRDEVAAKLAASMPDDREGLLNVARAAVVAFDAAVLTGDLDASEVAWNRYQAAVWKLHGQTFFGCYGNNLAGGYQCQDHCQADPGSEPMWGQKGEFVASTANVRALVYYGGFDYQDHEFHFIAISKDEPFISETGFRCHFFIDIPGGLTVAQAAALVLAKHPLVYLSVKSRASLSEHLLLPAWLAPVVHKASPVLTDLRPLAGDQLSLFALPTTKASFL